MRLIAPIKLLTRIPLPYLFALSLLALESAASRAHLFEQYHYWIALRDQPIVTVLLLMRLCLRLYAAYLIPVLLLELIVQSVPRPWRARLLPGLSRYLLFVVLYGVAGREVFVESPSISGFYDFYLPRWAALGGGFAWGLYLTAQLVQKRWVYPVRADAPWRMGTVAAASVGFLWLTAGAHPWTRASAKTVVPQDDKASIVLLGFDGLPADLLGARFGQHAAAPNWSSKWKERATRFENAYSVSNSTFTSWFSIFSGRYPFDSGVETLYPTRREGNQTLSDLLPRRLQALGYRTVFMTDCGTTSYMKPEYGFDRLYQLAPGLFRCGESLLTSKHPLAWYLGMGLLRERLVPELASFCSAQYRPEDFFREVEAVIASLRKDPRPYFLSVHSCATHQSMLHQPSMRSPLRNDLPPGLHGHSERMKHLMLSIRIADHYLDRLLQLVLSPPPNQTRRPEWAFFLSDHGTRIDRRDNHFKLFTHAMGMPVNRFQYHVPLAFWGPGALPRSDPHLVALTDLYPTLLDVAGARPTETVGSLLQAKADSSRGLVLTSAMPLELSADNREIFDAFWENRVDADGFHRFPAALEQRLLSRRPVAYLRLPYRLVMTPGKPLRLFLENEDPYGERNLAQEQPSLAERLKAELCGIYFGPGCGRPLGE